MNETRRTTLDGRILHAMDRARASTRRVYQVGPTSYRIKSFEDGPWYDLEVTRSGLTCSCPSTSVCKHMAKLSMRLQREHKPEVLSDYFEYDTELFAGEDVVAPEPDELTEHCYHCHDTGWWHPDASTLERCMACVDDLPLAPLPEPTPIRRSSSLENMFDTSPGYVHRTGTG
jgi:hypothetical protein